MDKSEPNLVPEWLRSYGSTTGSGGSSHHFASSQSNGPLLALPKRNKSSKIVANSDSLHSSFVEWNSSNSQRSSKSNASAKNKKNHSFRSYSSFTKSHRDKEREKLTIDDHWDSEYSDPLSSIMIGKIEKDVLRHSQSMVSGKPVWSFSEEFMQVQGALAVAIMKRQMVCPSVIRLWFVGHLEGISITWI